jgi:hypothetical protein
MEYPVFFKEMGLSASDTIAIISDTESKGIFSDKGIDAIKEASISLREMAKTTREAVEGLGIDSVQLQKDIENGNMTMFDAVQKISLEMSKLPESSTEVGQAIADIFRGAGEDAGLEYLTTLKDINLELEDLPVKMSAAEIASNNLTESWTTFSDNLNDTDGAITGMSNFIKTDF